MPANFDLNHVFNLQKYIFGQYLQVKEYGNKYYQLL
jgi:hypothetical protein